MTDNQNPGEDQLTKEEIKLLLTNISEELSQRPPVIGLIGVSGVGKSSTINSLFGTKLATSDTVACTKEFIATDVAANFLKGNVQKKISLRVVDAPGLGEDISLDPRYIKMYQENLFQCDIILWILAARNRAVALDQRYLQELSKFHEKMVFGVNQVDLIEPVDWDRDINLPSKKQEENIKIIVEDRAEKLRNILRRPVEIIPYSAKASYNLQLLFLKLIESCPADRAWIFDALKAFKYDDFVPEKYREIAKMVGVETMATAEDPEVVRNGTKDRAGELDGDQKYIQPDNTLKGKFWSRRTKRGGKQS